jgi:hypothetical protein
MQKGTRNPTRPDGLTQRQAEVVRALYRLTAAAQRPPTARELCKALGSKNVALVYGKAGFLALLSMKGWLLPADPVEPSDHCARHSPITGECNTARSSARLAGCALRATPWGVGLVFDTESNGCGGMRMTAQAERLWAVVFGRDEPKAA